MDRQVLKKVDSMAASSPCPDLQNAVYLRPFGPDHTNSSLRGADPLLSVFVQHCRRPLARAATAVAMMLAAVCATPPVLLAEPLPQIQVKVAGKSLQVREFSRTPYVAWDELAGAFGLENYFSEATGTYSLINATPGKEMAVELTPGAREVTVNGEVRKMPAVPLVKDGVLWLPVKPFADLLGFPAKRLKFSRTTGAAPTQERPADTGAAAPPAPKTTAPSPPAASPAEPPAPSRATQRIKLPPVPQVGEPERSRFAGFRIALFARNNHDEKKDDPRAIGVVHRLRNLLEESGFPVQELPPAAVWPAPSAVNLLRPHLALLLELSPRRDRFWILHPGASRPSPAGQPDGVRGPAPDEAALTVELAGQTAELMARMTGVAGQAQPEPGLLPCSRLMAASLLLDFPARVGASGAGGETAIARALHDGVVFVLGERARRSPAPAPSATPATVSAPPPATTSAAAAPPQPPVGPTDAVVPVAPPAPVAPVAPIAPPPALDPAVPAPAATAPDYDNPPGIDTPAQEEPDPPGIDTPATEEPSDAPPAVEPPADEPPVTAPPAPRNPRAPAARDPIDLPGGEPPAGEDGSYSPLPPDREGEAQ